MGHEDEIVRTVAGHIRHQHLTWLVLPRFAAGEDLGLEDRELGHREQPSPIAEAEDVDCLASGIQHHEIEASIAIEIPGTDLMRHGPVVVGTPTRRFREAGTISFQSDHREGILPDQHEIIPAGSRGTDTGERTTKDVVRHDSLDGNLVRDHPSVAGSLEDQQLATVAVDRHQSIPDRLHRDQLRATLCIELGHDSPSAFGIEADGTNVVPIRDQEFVGSVTVDVETSGVACGGGADQAELGHVVLAQKFEAIARPAKNGHRPVLGEEQEIIDHLSKVEFGTWFQLQDDKGIQRRLKLSWFSPVTSKYMFVDRFGIQALIIPINNLMLQIESGKANIMEDPELPFFDRAMLSINTMLKKAFST